MKCPTCLSTMKCISEIHDVPGQPGRQRMDLHCYNRGDFRDANLCRVQCHMGVITEDPKKWVCHDYSFGLWYRDSVDKGNHYYILSAYDYMVDVYHQSRSSGGKTILNDITGDIIVLPYFIPISTGDDMHEKVWELFHRLRNIIAFS